MKAGISVDRVKSGTSAGRLAHRGGDSERFAPEDEMRHTGNLSKRIHQHHPAGFGGSTHGSFRLSFSARADRSSLSVVLRDTSSIRSIRNAERVTASYTV